MANRLSPSLYYCAMEREDRQEMDNMDECAPAAETQPLEHD